MIAVMDDAKQDARREIVIGALIESPAILLALFAYLSGSEEMGSFYYPSFAVAFLIWIIGLTKMLGAAKRLNDAQKK